MYVNSDFLSNYFFTYYCSFNIENEDKIVVDLIGVTVRKDDCSLIPFF